MNNAMRVDDDFGPITNALAKWWESQQVSPPIASFIMAGMAGGIAGGIIATSKDQLDVGLALLVKEMRRAAYAANKARIKRDR